MIAITGATGQLGRLVLNQLLARVPPGSVATIVRDAAKAADFTARGVSVRLAGYDDPAALTNALSGVETLLLISSSEIGRRTRQHRNVIEAAKLAGVGRLVYTSLLHADTSPLSLAAEHVATEKLIRESGLPFVILRNGWYAENYTVSIPAALAHGAFVGSAGDGRISLATRDDYAAAAVAVLTKPVPSGTLYELAGDQAVTLTELAAEISRQTGKQIPYQDLPVDRYASILRDAGLPDELATSLAQWDADASRDALFENNGQLGRLIGRPTTPLAEAVRRTLAA